MDHTPATANPSGQPDASVVPCKRIRTKMYYVLGRQAVDLSKSSPTAQYWCSRTATVIGPDDVCCSPEICVPTRACYESEDE